MAHRKVFAISPAVPTYLRWLEAPITYDRSDHPDLVPKLGRYPLVVDPIVGSKRLTKVLMDGGGRLNILYADTLKAMGIPHSRLQPTSSPFYGVVPGKQARPLGRIDLPVTFGDPNNFRTKTLTFEVIGFPGSNHAILGRPCYTKFMAIPNYIYLKLKMPGPKGVITIGASFEVAYACEQSCCELASMAVASAELSHLQREICEATLDSNKPRASLSFKSIEDTKAVGIDPEDLTKVRIGAALSPM